MQIFLATRSIFLKKQQNLMTMTGQELSNKITELGITRQEASDLLGVSIRTLQYWTKKKEVKTKALKLLEEKLGIKDCSPDVQNVDMVQTQPAIFEQPAIFNTAKVQEPTLTQKSVALYEELITQLKERIADQKRTITLLEEILKKNDKEFEDKIMENLTQKMITQMQNLMRKEENIQKIG